MTVAQHQSAAQQRRKHLFVLKRRNTEQRSVWYKVTVFVPMELFFFCVFVYGLYMCLAIDWISAYGGFMVFRTVDRFCHSLQLAVLWRKN